MALYTVKTVDQLAAAAANSGTDKAVIGQSNELVRNAFSSLDLSTALAKGASSGLSARSFANLLEDLNFAVGIPVRGYTGAATQAAINEAVARGGGNIILPAGDHYWTDQQPTINLAALAAQYTGARLNFIGAGSSSCRVHLDTNNATALAVTGGDWALGGANLRMRIGGFTLHGGSNNKANNRIGISLNKVSQCEFFDLEVAYCELGISLVDTVFTRFISCWIVNNAYGLHGDPGPDYLTNVGCPPNEMAFVGTHFMFNTEHGIWLNKSTNISFIGGSFENNGYLGSDTDKWAIRITDGGFNGAHILGMYGTHFEGTTGKAGIWIEHDNWPGIYNIDSDFVRNGIYAPSGHATNEILFDTTGDTKAVVNVRSGFHSVNGYTPSAARRYIAQGTVTGTAHRINYLGSMFESATEMPSFSDGSLVPPVDIITVLGGQFNRFKDAWLTNIWLNGDITILAGDGSPEGVVTANPGSWYFRNNGSAATYLYRKTGAGFNSTGWTALL